MQPHQHITTITHHQSVRHLKVENVKVEHIVHQINQNEHIGSMASQNTITNVEEVDGEVQLHNADVYIDAE